MEDQLCDRYEKKVNFPVIFSFSPHKKGGVKSTPPSIL